MVKIGPARSTASKAHSGAGARSESRLLAAARNGDAAALTELLELASGPAYRFSKGFCRDPHDAEDLVQEVLATLLRSLATFRGESSLSTWTYTVARRACGRLRKRGARSSSLDAMLETREFAAATADEPAPRAERRELSAALEHAIAGLPMVHREVVVLRDVEGLPASEVARVLGIGERAVKSRLHRARMALRETLAPFMTPPRAQGLAPLPSCPDTALLLSRYVEGELSPQVCERMHAHLETCPACDERCDSLRSVLGACRAYGERKVPADLKRAVRAAIRIYLRRSQEERPVSRR